MDCVDALLRGGSYDGARGVLYNFPTPPQMVGAYTCPACRSIHIEELAEAKRVLGPTGALVRYRFVRLHDSGEAIYRYADSNDYEPSGRSVPTEELERHEDIMEPVEPMTA